MTFRSTISIMTVVAVAAFVGGCRTNLLGGSDDPVPIPPAPPQQVVVDGVRTSYADVVERTSPAVVRIQSERKETASKPGQHPFGDDFFRQFQVPQPDQRPRVERGAGSGVIVESDGTILTNFHVVEGSEKITVLTNDNRSFAAKIIGTDQLSDLAVLKIEATGLSHLKLGDSDSVRVGDVVLAIGNPLGIGQTVTAGIISAKGRQTGLSDGSFEDFLQTDAPINRGNSGGALVNLNSELIGINSQILSGGPSGGNIGIAFSIPSNMARSVMEQLLKDGKVRRGLLGINIQNISGDLAEGLELKQNNGVIVTGVRSGSAADKAGIKQDDIVLAINDEKISDSNSLRNKIAGTLPGTAVKVTVLRNGQEMDVTATLDEFTSETTGNQPGEQAPGGPRPEKQGGKLGLNLEPLTPAAAKRLGVPESTEGLVVTGVDPSGPAAELGITPGDVILAINRTPVRTTADAESALENSGNRPVVLLINRKGQTIYLTVRP
jgi:serine protease Do